MAEYIEKDKAKELVCEFCTWVGTSNCEECEHPVDDVPAADVQPVMHGEWIGYPECLKYENAYSDDHIVCSVCEECFSIIDNDTERFNYCPNCGAKMDKETE